jgi:hypothetical protein
MVAYAAHYATEDVGGGADYGFPLACHVRLRGDDEEVMAEMTVTGFMNECALCAVQLRHHTERLVGRYPSM